MLQSGDSGSEPREVFPFPGLGFTAGKSSGTELEPILSRKHWDKGGAQSNVTALEPHELLSLYNIQQ